MQVNDYIAAAVLASTVLAEVEAAGADIKAGQGATVSSPVPVSLLRNQYNLNVGWSPAGGVGFSFGGDLLGHVIALTTLIGALAAQGASVIASIQAGSGFSFSCSLSLYGHHGSLTISGTPAAAAPAA